MRAVEPTSDGFVDRDGVKIYYEVFGSGEPTVLLLPTWSLVHSRQWKLQVADLALRWRVVTFDGRGNGRSDRPESPAAYAPREFAGDALAVLDAVGADRAVMVGWSMGARWAAELGAYHPERVDGIVFIGPALPLAPMPPDRTRYSFTDRLDTDDGWARFNQHFWRERYRDFLDFFLAQIFTEPHSTKPQEDGVGWALETDPDTLVATIIGGWSHDRDRWGDPESARSTMRRIRCPVLVIHGEEDAVRPVAAGEATAELTGGSLVTIEGGGHGPHLRDPIHVNLLLREFIGSISPPRRQERRRWTRGLRRQRKALYISSPIGLGHARRDVAIAAELRRRHPDLDIDWLAQDPVTRVLHTEGERVHPASVLLSNESAHVASESVEHDLHCFQAVRRMDEIMVRNFMVFHDVIADGRYDVVIGDEAWEVDHHLHENPELKRTQFVWMTDFVGWLPMPDGADREAFITADYNAEMIAHIDRYPSLRDRAIFVGNPEDIVPARFGPGLPGIREWTEAHFDFAGYVTGFDPGDLTDMEALRAELGYHPDERVCIVTVGGSGVGEALLRRVIASYPAAKRLVPELRMVVVAGPRIDPAGLPTADGLAVAAFVPNLYRHLAACDLAIVQGGLTTCMELTARQRPFLYFPLAHHFEQNFHVTHRLNGYRAGRRMDYATTEPEALAEVIATEIGRSVDYRPVETDGAARAAALIAELL